MPILNGNDFLAAGYQPGPIIAELIEALAALEAKGILDPDYAMKLLKRDYPMAAPKLRLRDDALDFSEAIEAEYPAEEKNVNAVRRFMRELMRVPVVQAGAVMPDACPAGSGPATIPVGGAIAVRNAIIPSAHSADICCSMYATFFDSDAPVADTMDALLASTRFGFGGRSTNDLVHHPVLDEEVWKNPFLQGLKDKATIHMADQGDGNHFAFLGEIEVRAAFVERLRASGYPELAAQLLPDEFPEASRRLRVLVTHHGSRGLGAAVYKRGQNAAERETKRVAEGIPKAAAWLDTNTDVGADYWEALQYVSRWTKANHQSIHRRFLERLGAFEQGEAAEQGHGLTAEELGAMAVPPVAAFGNEHNFVWKRGQMYLHGKGATPAWTDAEGRPLLGLIPLNMSEPILLVLGGDNEDHLSFAPHGAGRNQSRTATLREYRTKNGELDNSKIRDKIANTTEGLDVRWFYGKADLTETPVAYKNAAAVRAQIDTFELAEVVGEIHPLGCIMAGTPPKRGEKPLSPKQKRQIQHRAERRKSKQVRWDASDEDE